MEILLESIAIWMVPRGTLRARLFSALTDFVREAVVKECRQFGDPACEAHPFGSRGRHLVQFFH
ncbi:hypothetical protein OC610_12815 [Pseudomonas sp. SAICEU22]|uniref:Uncharacterized protein n=1 Tax=Pseudomonas agronomica TaxID=2979328 RepID=A0ABT3F8D2_9PSED|nr:hypothetical protein [Pseudomonas agronomica]MCW1245292.1 hypothetical protein [Pseudomonas agronomica]